MKYIYIILLLIIFSIPKLQAQPPNYWSMASNTESSLLAGAVVGGGSGITSIFYNPSGISELDDNKISINASLFHFNLSDYKNAFGSKNKIQYLDYQVQPRFFSFVYHPKSAPRLSLQYAVFSRGQSLNKLYDSGVERIKENSTGEDKYYTASFNYENRYNDTWLGIGSSYKINDKFTLGISILGSVKGLLYHENLDIDLIPTTDTVSFISAYNYVDRQDLHVISLISKIGANYKFGLWSLGVNLTLPSLRIYGDGYHRREVSMLNIVTDEGLQPDFIRKEVNYHIVANFKEPMAVSMGFVKINTKKDLNIYFSAEYFFPIAKYKSIDNSRVANLYKDDYSPGTDFLTYQYSSKSIFNIAIGMKKNISEKLYFMSGFKTNFASNELTDFSGNNMYGQYVKAYSSLYHLTTGITFDYKRINALFGLEYSFGLEKDIYQFRNLEYTSLFDTKNYYALQDYPKQDMHYVYNGLGIYFGLGFNF